MPNPVDHIRRFHTDLIAFRRDMHAHPELAFAEQRTADLVAARLAEFGCEVYRGLAGTGVIEVCARCREHWPCMCRLLAEGALAEAERRPRGRPVRNQAYLDLLRARLAERTTDDP